MKATGIPLHEVIQRIASRGKREYRKENGWCDDLYLFQITSEEFMNLQALAARHPELKATDKELDDLDKALRTINPIERMHIGRE